MYVNFTFSFLLKLLPDGQQLCTSRVPPTGGARLAHQGREIPEGTREDEKVAKVHEATG